MLTINELAERTGLKITFIRKCLKPLKPVLAPHLQRGNANSLLFTTSAVVIFDKIRQLKDEGLALPAIKRQLEGTLKAGQTAQTAKVMDVKPAQTVAQTVAQTGSNRSNPESWPTEWLEKFLQLQERLSEEKEKRLREREESYRVIRELETTTQELRGAFKLLPEGKSPEQIKAEWEREQARKREAAAILAELKTLGVLRFGRRKKLLKRLEELTS